MEPRKIAATRNTARRSDAQQKNPGMWGVGLGAILSTLHAPRLAPHALEHHQTAAATAKKIKLEKGCL